MWRSHFPNHDTPTIISRWHLQGIPAAGCSRVHALPPGSSALRTPHPATLPQLYQPLHLSEGQEYDRYGHIRWDSTERGQLSGVPRGVAQTRPVPRCVLVGVI